MYDFSDAEEMLLHIERCYYTPQEQLEEIHSRELILRKQLAIILNAKKLWKEKWR